MTAPRWQAWLLCLLLFALVHSTPEEAGASESCALDGDATCSEENSDNATGSTNAHNEESCGDAYRGPCQYWAWRGDCEEKPRFMLSNCPKSCNICGNNTLEAFDLGMKQDIDSKHKKECHDRIASAKHYVAHAIAKDPKQRRLLEGCKNKHQSCAYWAALGECEANPGYMKLHCAPVCHSCDQLSVETRCPYDPETMPSVWKPGDLNEFFTNLTTLERFAQYEPNVMSRPEYLPGDTEETADYKVGPWVVLLENVVTDEEAERLIELGRIEGYERSTGVGEKKFDGTFEDDVTDTRTSTNSWCYEECAEDPLAQRVIQKVTEISNIPEENSEYLQLLNYQVGQFYKTHHDYLDDSKYTYDGPRILTIFLYLNDVEEGGGTEFPDLGITVSPKRGRALIWPSVLNEDPETMEPLTEHQALPVIKGQKFAANAWIHLRNTRLDCDPE